MSSISNSDKKSKQVVPDPTQDSEKESPSSEKDFKWEKREIESTSLIPGRSFPETVCTLLLISFLFILLHSLTQILGDLITSNIAIIGALFCYHFLAVHSYKLSRKCNLVFDEANLLLLTTNFEYELGFLDDCVTPAVGADVKVEPPKPSSLWEALFFEDKAYKMNEFYNRLYGGEYERAMRIEADERARRALSESKTPAIPPNKSHSIVASPMSFPSSTPN